MKRTIFRSGWLVAVLCLSAAVHSGAQKQAPPEGGPAKAFTVPAHETYTLPNGLEVTLVPYGMLPKVTVDIMIVAGSADEGKDHQGVADFTANLMKEGTQKLTSSQLADATARMGSTLDVSFGGWSGKKLGSSCKTPAALAAAYQQVIDAYSLKAIDIDIEHGEFNNRKTRKRVVEALAAVRAANPGLEISVTMGTAETGPEAAGLSLIADAAAVGFMPDAWTVMPFDFGTPRTDMGHASVRALEGLAAALSSAYGIGIDEAYEHAGVSSMNGRTDEASETVDIEDMQTILTFAAARGLARVAFWSVNRDRSCAGADTSSDSCSDIAQQPLAFTKLLAGYHG